jgi:hypothetical protein
VKAANGDNAVKLSLQATGRTAHRRGEQAATGSVKTRGDGFARADAPVDVADSTVRQYLTSARTAAWSDPWIPSRGSVPSTSARTTWPRPRACGHPTST